MALLHIDWNPDRGKLNAFGVGMIVFFGLFAALAVLQGRPARAGSLFAAGLILGAAVLLSDVLGLFIYKAWMCVAFVIGTVVSHAALAIIYYGMVTPLAVYFRLTGRDALRLRRGAARSYWSPLKEPSDMSYFERLF